MGLELNQVREILKEPKINKGNKIKALELQNRVKFHGINITDAGTTSARNKFLNHVKDILPGDKFTMFEKLFKGVDTQKLVTEIYSELNKVFEGVNSVFDWDFTSEDYSDDYIDYRTKKLGGNAVWKLTAFEKMKTAYNSFLVVDLPEVQESELPEPYFYWLDFSRVHSYEEKDGEIQNIVFRGMGNTMFAYDDQYYRKFEYVDGEIVGEVYEVSHDLGYCPVCWFWSDLIGDLPELKRSPITNYLDKLDWLLFFSISKRYADLYAPYPVYWGYTQDCSYSTEYVRCSNGFLTDNVGNVVIEGGKPKVCPGCKDRINGVGSFVDVPPPSELNDHAQLAPPVGMVNVDIDALNYGVEEVKRLEGEIYTAITGNSLESVTHGQAVNEMQINSLFEARTQTLISLKRNFEEAQKFVESTVCKLRYGNAFVGCVIDYGTDFYLYSASDMLSIYEQAKVNKVDVLTLDLLQNRYYDTLYRNDEKSRRRMSVVLNLDPYRHLTNEEAKELSELEGRPDKYLLKVNLSSLIMAFERVNGAIENFGVLLDDFSQRIEIIRTELINILNIENGTT